MLISEKINHAFNQQIGYEFGNSHQYVAIAAYFEGKALFGLAKIFYAQAVEEGDHALKFIKFLLDAGGKISFPGIPTPRCQFESAIEAAQQAFDSEMVTTQQINDLVTLASEEKTTSRPISFSGSSPTSSRKSPGQTRLAVIRRPGRTC